jgi:two-component system chemotaxis sensor kinase CheA
VKLADGITQDDLKLFLQEADEQIQLLDEDILKLEREDVNEELLQGIFRAAHTIKGSSAMIGHHKMSELAHGIENVLDKLRKKTLVVTPEIIDVLLASLDILRTLRDVLTSPEENEPDISATVNQLEKILDVAPESQERKQTKRTVKSINTELGEKLKLAISEKNNIFEIKIYLEKDTAWASVRCFQVLQELSQMGEIIISIPSQEDIEEAKVDTNMEMLFASVADEKAIKEMLKTIPEIENIEIHPRTLNDIEIAAAKGAENTNSSATRKDDFKLAQTVRVDIVRLDVLMEQIGELVINRNRIDQLSRRLEERYRGDDLVLDLGKTSSQVGKIVTALQQDIMKIRMLPIEIVFNAFPRMIRDMARKANKKIDFIVEGQDTEVDRSVIEHLRDPLVHLLRNAVDHGIEPPEQRTASGKPETATVRLSACHEQDHIKIMVEDDGKGIDPDTIKESAVKKGLITAETAAKLNTAESINLIFSSGLSTAKKTTEISGRGVGMDIVKTNIEDINGSVLVDSQVGKGTRFTLILPLTLAIIPSLLISINRTTCAIPLINIEETVKLEPDAINTVRGKEVTMLRGNVLPLLRLDHSFGWNTNGEVNKSGSKYIVVVRTDELRVGLVVDELIEEQEIVMKSIGSIFSEVEGITGASILGDGTVVLILDIASLIKASIAQSQRRIKEGVRVLS